MMTAAAAEAEGDCVNGRRVIGLSSPSLNARNYCSADLFCDLLNFLSEQKRINSISKSESRWIQRDPKLTSVSFVDQSPLNSITKLQYDDVGLISGSS